MDKLKMETPNMTDRNIEKILELFPNVATEKEDENGKLKIAIDFDKLKQELSETIIEGDESYDFTWVGKREAMVEATRPIRKTLRPVRESSLNWEDTENIYIEGDNLEALKLLQESYLGKVKIIYIDPPYNTGKDFVYRDNFVQDKESYDAELGIIDEYGNKLFQNTESNGRFHSDWCSMIYPRLKLAKNLLSEDGVIFISIDDNELNNLRKISDEIFGESNFVACLPRHTTTKGKNDEQRIGSSHDYVLIYLNSGLTIFNKDENFKSKNRYKLKDDIGLYYAEAPLDSVSLPYQASLDFPINFNGKIYNPIKKDTKKVSWRWCKELVEFGIENNLIVEKDNRLYTKTYLEYEIKKENNKYQIVPKEVGGTYKTQMLWNLADVNDEIMEYDYGNNEATAILTKLKIPFNYSKPSKLIERLIQLIKDTEECIVLDFFSGSATTAEAVFNLNEKDNGKRKFILIQLPEPTDPSSVAYKAHFKNICEIGEERIRRAGKKIQEENPDKKIDIGFRVFKVDDTSMKDVYYSPKEYSQNFLDKLESNIKEDRTDEDLLYGVLLDWGVELSLPHKIEIIDGKKIHIVNEDDLIACFENNISETVVREIAKKQPTRVVFRDSSFNGDDNKINVDEIFKLLAPNTTVKVI